MSNLQKSDEAGHIREYKIINLPNIISLLRILAAPFLILLLLSPDKKASVVAAAIFALASLTDWLDGYVARRMGVVTSFGKFLDPLADKLLIVTCLVMLIPAGRAPAWMVALIIGREIAVTGLRGMAALEGIVFAASNLGKYKTIFQIAAVTSLILHFKFSGVDFHVAGIILLWIALAVTVISGIDYFVRFFRKTGVLGIAGIISCLAKFSSLFDA